MYKTPQTNGKIERFWRTLQGDFLEGSLYEDIDDLTNELLGVFGAIIITIVLVLHYKN